MSGGQLVVLDRLGRDVKRYPLPEGLATLGSDPACDIRVLLPAVSPHHATVVVHANQTVVRNVSTGETLVNGAPVSVAALRHGDVISLGGRALRWEYADHAARAPPAPLAPHPAVYVRTRAPRVSPARRGRRSAGPPPAPRPPALRLALELQHRASAPAAGKQVAIVQPQRRDHAEPIGIATPPRQNTSAKRSRTSNNDLDSSVGSEPETSKRKSNAARPSPRNTSLQGTTKASMWIESRKSSPRKSGRPPTPAAPAVSPRRGLAAGKPTPLRMAVLRKAQSASKVNVTKIEAPLTVDHTKQAAIMLMTRHTPKKSPHHQPSFLVKKRTPRAAPSTSPSNGNTPTRASKSPSDGNPRGRGSNSPSTASPRVANNSTLVGSPASKRGSRSAGNSSLRARGRASKGGPNVGRASRARASRTLNGTNEALLLELSESNASQSSSTPRSTPQLSPMLPSPKKSALKNPAAKKSSRKTESIKFDLSNLDNYDQSHDVVVVSDVSRKDDDSQSETDLTLHYESSIKSPSPRKSIHSSRSSKILEKTLGTTMSDPHSSIRTLTPESPRPRKSSRVSSIVQKALETSGNSRYSQRTTKSLSDESYDTTVASAFKTRTLSPRSPSQKNMESYSIVDLVSVDSNQSGSSSVYNSMRTTKSSSDTFGTPQNSTGRKTSSTIDPTLLTSSTPYVAKKRPSNQRASSSPNISRSSKNESQVSHGSSRRSKSLSTPENTQKHISVNSTRVSRASRSRSRYDSDLFLISTVNDDESPRTSKTHNRTDKSILSPKSPVISPKRLSRASKSILSPKSPVTSPKRLSRGSKSILSPKSPVSSPKWLSRGSKSIVSIHSPSPKAQIRGSKSKLSPKSPITSPPRQSRSTKSVSISQSPVLSPKQLSRASKSMMSPKSPITSPQRQGRSSKSASVSQSPVLSPKQQSSVSKSILSPKSPISPQRQSIESKSASSPKSASPKSRSRASKSILSPKSPVISTKRISRSSKSILSPKSPGPSPKRASRSTKSIASPTSPISSPKSPKSSSKSPKSGRKSNVSSANARKSRRTMNTPSGSPGNEGVSTPENRQSPVEVGTPVLSIQSLLDSSQSSLVSQRSAKKGRGSVKRKTIGGIPPKPKKDRASLKSKSFNFGARRTASRLSKDSGASDKTLDRTNAQKEDVVTPKSAVKLVQEAVKNKHSTAKKPQSKRSIIDDLNESDIVKQLFNSPVKRKLSQSMTEFSRKQLFEDDEVVVVKRPTRNTVALGQTPDNSIILNQTESYTPEVFISPLGTPSNSPNLTGIKRLFKKQMPDNDLRNVKGVKGLLRTPRTRRSIRNDLTQVSGVKNLFARSPKNRLSDVRVKEVFAASPRNDLRRVTGVKSLFQSQKKGRKSPKNDLRDVRGVKQLFIASSPANDLRNVSGVKKVLRRNSPRNDLSDVRGVKKIFRQEKQHDNMEVSGIEELFNESNNSYRDHSAQLSESLFDKLVGKPPIKAVYSRTFTKKADKSHKNRRGHSLRVSIDEIIAHPEEWIQKELEKRFEKKHGNASRELQKLATDTVEGNAPMRTSRVRNSTLVQSVSEHADRKRSTAESYSAHTLPIKKRSLVEVSGREQRSRASRGPGLPRSSVLPIKKRALVHSTPVKGRADATLAADLGRVSPIALDNSTRFTSTVVEVPVLQTTRQSTKARADSPKAKTVSPKAKVASPKGTAASPKAKIASPKAKVASPKAKIASPKAKVASPKAKALKTKVASPKAKALKAKVASPKAKVLKAKVATPQIVVISPKKTRGKINIVVSPKNTRKARNETVAISPKTTRKYKNNSATKKPTLVVAKKAPILSPKPTRATKTAASPSKAKHNALKEAKSPSPQKRGTRKQKTVTEMVTEEVKPQSPKKIRGKRVSLVVSKPSPKMKPRPGKAQPKDVQQTEEASKAQELPEKTRRTRKTTAPTEDKKTESPKATSRATRTRKTSEVAVKEDSKAAKAKGKAQKQPKTNKDKSVEEKPTKTRGKKANVSVEANKKEPARATRGKKNEATEQKVESPKRGRKAVAEVEKPVAQKRGRKTEEVEPKPEPQKRGRGRKTVEIEEKPASPKRVKKSEVEKSVATRRGKNTEPVVAQKVEPPKRGRKVEAKAEQKPIAQRRGRNTEVEIEQKVVSPKRGRKETKVEEKPVAQTRGRKTEAQKEVKAQTRGKRDASEAQSSKSSVSVLPKGKRGKVSEPVPEKKTRGRKAELEVEVAGGRKRKSARADVSPAKVRKTRAGDVAHAKAAGRHTDNQPAAEVPTSRKRKTAPETPAKPAKESGKRAKRVVVKPATPVSKRHARTKAEPKVAKRSTRGKR